MTARQHDHRVGRELHRRHAPLRQCSNATQIAGWLRAYEAVYGLEAARTYFAAFRQLQADDKFEDVKAAVDRSYDENGYHDAAGYDEGTAWRI